VAVDERKSATRIENLLQLYGGVADLAGSNKVPIIAFRDKRDDLRLGIIMTAPFKPEKQSNKQQYSFPDEIYFRYTKKDYVLCVDVLIEIDSTSHYIVDQDRTNIHEPL
jgi:hypothetical protein